MFYIIFFIYNIIEKRQIINKNLFFIIINKSINIKTIYIKT